MFILRRITSEGLESNTCIGDSYNFVAAYKDKQQYELTLKVYYGDQAKNYSNDLAGFVVYKEGEKIIPLSRKSTFYIMTESGQTFDRLHKGEVSTKVEEGTTPEGKEGEVFPNAMCDKCGKGYFSTSTTAVCPECGK